MKTKNNLKILILSCIMGIIFTAYLLFKRRGGYFAVSDWIALCVILVIVAGLIYYFKGKWKQE